MPSSQKKSKGSKPSGSASMAASGEAGRSKDAKNSSNPNSSVSAGTRKRHLKKKGSSTGGEITKTQVTPQDVLVGRGKGAYMSEGNLRFQKLVCDNLGAYKRALKNPDKAEITRQIVDTIKKAGGRFLKEDEDCVGQFVEICDRQARVKVAQALRRWRRMDEQGEFVAGSASPLESRSDSPETSTSAPETKAPPPPSPAKKAEIPTVAKKEKTLEALQATPQDIMARHQMQLQQLQAAKQLEAAKQLQAATNPHLAVGAPGAMSAYGIAAAAAEHRQAQQQYNSLVASSPAMALAAARTGFLAAPAVTVPSTGTSLLRQRILEAATQSLAAPKMDEEPSYGMTTFQNKSVVAASMKNPPSELDVLDAGQALCALSSVAKASQDKGGQPENRKAPAASRPLKKRIMKSLAS